MSVGRFTIGRTSKPFRTPNRWRFARLRLQFLEDRTVPTVAYGPAQNGIAIGTNSSQGFAITGSELAKSTTFLPPTYFFLNQTLASVSSLTEQAEPLVIA